MRDFLDQIFDGLDLCINQLKVKTDDVDLMKWIIQRITGLQSVQFLYYYSISTIWKELLDWLSLLNVRFSSSEDETSLTISFQSVTGQNYH